MRENFGRSAVQGTLALVVALVLPFAARAADEGEIRNYIISINSLYENLDYEVALNRIQLARQLPRGTDDEVTLSLYQGIILYEMGKQGPGTSMFKSALQLRPDAKLPVQVAPKLEALFESVRKQVKQEMAALLPPRATENPTTRPKQKQEVPPTAPPLTPPPKESGDMKLAQTHTTQDGGLLARESIDKNPQREAERQEAEQKAERQEAERQEAERREAERAQLKKKARDAANLDTSRCQSIVSIACEMLMKRLSSLRVAFLRTDSPSQPVHLRELSMIGQEIRAARTREELREATQALDGWQQRHLSQ